MLAAADERLRPQEKIVLHPQFAAYMAGARVYPVGLEISPCGICNAHCDFCLVPGTKIDTPSGVLNVETVSPGNEVYGPDGRVNKVTAVGARYAEVVLHIRCGERTITVTPEHPFLTEQGWMEAKDIRPGTRAVMRMWVRGAGESKCLPTTFLEPYDKGSQDQSQAHAVGGTPLVQMRLPPPRSMECGSGAMEQDYQGPPRTALPAEEKPGRTAAPVRVRMRNSGKHASREMEQVCCKRSYEQGTEYAAEGANSAFRTDEEKQPYETGGGCCQSINGNERKASPPVRVCGIELECGLELLPVDSVREEKAYVKVYNFSCTPTEAYEANGFVVHNCFYANTGELGDHRNVMLDVATLTQVLCDAADLGVKAVTWTGGGEPTLHSAFDRVVRFAAGLGLQQGLFTNALAAPRYDPALLEWVRVTLTDRPVRPEYVSRLRPAKALGFAFNYAGPQDDAALVDLLAVAESVGADYVQVRPALAFHGATVDIQPPGITHRLLHITDYKFAEARHKHSYARCEGFHFVPFLWENGNLDVCAYNRKHPGYTLGNVYKNTLKEILDAAPATVPVHDACQVCCKLHEINKLVAAARGTADVNFP